MALNSWSQLGGLGICKVLREMLGLLVFKFRAPLLSSWKRVLGELTELVQALVGIEGLLSLFWGSVLVCGNWAQPSH